MTATRGSASASIDYDSGHGHYQAFTTREPAPGMAAGAQFEVLAEDGYRAGWIAQQQDGTFVTYLAAGHRLRKCLSMLEALLNVADFDEDRG
jgi:hypothetical protein